MTNPLLQTLKNQQEDNIAVLESWANINSSSDNLTGLALMRKALQSAFAPLKCETKIIPLSPLKKINEKGVLVEQPLGDALRFTKHPSASTQIFLGGHMDTVYPANHPFQKAERLNAHTLRGPGVADMKGGLLVMLKALELLEASPHSGKIGWEVLINSDEEIGSPGSQSLFVEGSKRNVLGLIFEPSFSDGALVSSRKGSANFAVVVRGRSAHAGRDFYSGRNAITALMQFMLAVEALNDKEKEITINIGNIQGGGPSNIVPDLAICHFNVRTIQPQDMEQVIATLHQLAKQPFADGISVTLHEQSSARAPKLFDQKNKQLFDQINRCAKELGMTLQTRPSGGVCDGNILSEEGLPVVDTLGVVGGNIHTQEEYMLVESIAERAALVALLLIKIASGELKP